jgi:hypothetical protein
LKIVGRGQEFVADIGNCSEPRAWLEHVITIIKSTRS